MGNPSARLFRLLALLQARRVWAGAELARRLEVTERTVRRDVDELRELGYVIESLTGTAGGYRLSAGASLPPLQLDDEEAVAIAAALLTADGAGEPASRALAKLEQVLPRRLRSRLGGVTASTVTIGEERSNAVDPAVLGVLAAACRDLELVEFGYTRMDGASSQRKVAPHHLVTGYGLWYLIAHDDHRDDWRIFRVDRITEPFPTVRRFSKRELPSAPAEYLRAAVESTPYPYTAVATVEASAERVRACLTRPLPGRVTAIGAERCRVRFGASELETILGELLDIARLAVPFELDGPQALHERLEDIASQLTRSVHGR